MSDSEAQVRKSNDLLTKLAQLVPSALYQYRLWPDGRSAFPYSSPGIYNIYEVTPEEVREDATPVFGRLHPEDTDRIVFTIQESARTLSRYHSEFRVILPKQGLRWRLCDANPERLEDGSTLWHGIISDITDRKLAEATQLQLEQQEQKAQQLESLGVLAAGIAHDFNNLLGGIFGYVEMAKGCSSEPRISRYLEKTMATLERARGLTGQLLTFAKGGAPIKKTAALFPFVAETAQFVLSGSGVEFCLEVAPDLCPCDYDRNQLGQVIDNLVINARESMPEGGRLELSARNISLNGKEPTALPGGDYVRISFKDTGTGIPREHIERIFDPFYTTKTRGYGLGLATCQSIVTRHGGAIEVESEPGQGTVFHVYLPASRSPVTSITAQLVKDFPGSGTILIMDDEEIIRETLEAMLRSFGFTVVCTENGRDAVDFCRMRLKTGGTLAGIFFDVTVPGGMGGKAAIGEIRKICPDTPAFVVSGYSEDPVMSNPKAYGFTASLSKPFNRNELSKLLGRYLQSAAK